MPIIHTRFGVTWTPTPEDRARAMANHGGQSLEKLRDRMGVDWCELHAILADEPYGKGRVEEHSRKMVNLILRQRAGVFD